MEAPSCATEGHIRSANPRVNTCLRPGCNEILTDPQTRPRNVDLERAITHDAARGVVDADQFITHCETRASTLSGEYVSNSGLILLGRRRLRDAREEFTDARNHICWWEQWFDENRDPEDERWVLTALRHTLLAYDALGRVDE